MLRWLSVWVNVNNSEPEWKKLPGIEKNSVPAWRHVPSIILILPNGSVVYFVPRTRGFYCLATPHTSMQTMYLHYYVEICINFRSEPPRWLCRFIQDHGNGILLQQLNSHYVYHTFIIKQKFPKSYSVKKHTLLLNCARARAGTNSIEIISITFINIYDWYGTLWLDTMLCYAMQPNRKILIG